ncbi:MAG: MFS transporter [Promethearchaeota archaeon]
MQPAGVREQENGGERPPLNANLLAIFGTTLIAVMGVASITPAFPSMSIALSVPPSMISLLVIVFTLPGVILTPFLGVAADRYGRKQVLVPSLLLFGVAGFGCAFSEPLGLLLGTSPFFMLLILRVFQGAGAAALGSLNITIIGDLYHHRQRTQVMGYNVSVQSIATAIYPTVGGFLALFAWYFPFYLPLLALPIGLAVLIWLNVPKSKQLLNRREYFGQIWHILQDRQIAGLLIVSTAIFIMLYGAIITYLPFLLITMFSVDSFIAGLVVSFISVTSAFTAFLVGVLIRRYSMKGLLMAAFPFQTLGLFLIPFAPHLLIILIPIGLFGVGMGLATPTTQNLLVNLAPMENRAAVMSLNGLVLRLGQTLGPLIMAVVLGVLALPGVYFIGALIALALLPIVFLTVPSLDRSLIER